MILYFTGTGNSKFVADMIADITQDESVSINNIIKSGDTVSLHSEKPFVFVCPTYVSAIPRVVDSFIRNTAFTGSSDAYFIMTAAGGMGACPVYAEDICKAKNMNYMGTAQITMPQNYLVFFKTKTESEANKIIDDALPYISELASAISKNNKFPEINVSKLDKVSTAMILDAYYKWFMGTKKFTATDKCIGCHLCERMCPFNNIIITDGKPSWGNNCTHCMACINCCPQQAIEYGKSAVGKPRYKCRTYKPGK